MKNYDIVKVRKQKCTVYLALTVAYQDLITREDFANSFNRKTFTEREIDERLRRKPAISCYLENIPVAELKYLVLGVRKKFQRCITNGEGPKWRFWADESKELLRTLKTR